MATPSKRPPRAARPKLPLPDSFESLDETHRQVLKHLDLLAQLAQRLATQDVDATARQWARSITQFFDTTARAHHEAEERSVFPALLRGTDAALVQHVLRLQEDHGWIEADWREVAPHLLSIAEGHQGWQLEFLNDAIPAFTELYREHIVLEETTVYPAARRQQPGHAH
jgi:hemerythrin-like domain-containing protein